MRVICRQESEKNQSFQLWKEKEEIGCCRASRSPEGVRLEDLFVAEHWRRKGYGSYLLRRVLAVTGGFEKNGSSLHLLPPPQGQAEAALWGKFGFRPPRPALGTEPGAGEWWVRRRRADLTAVEWVHQNLSRWLAPGGFYIDATCGNGGDTEFLCRLAGEGGRVLALDLQAQAVENTNARLEQAGLAGVGRAVKADHARLAELAPPRSADCVLFNFGYLPGGDHGLFTTPATSLPALRAALELLRPGGVLAVCLYSGGPNGREEKTRVLSFLEGLPLAQYTTLTCRFANWAETAPLPCFVFYRGE